MGRGAKEILLGLSQRRVPKPKPALISGALSDPQWGTACGTPLLRVPKEKEDLGISAHFTILR